MTGAPVSAHKRLQFSLPLQKIPKVAMMAKLPEVMLPIMWVEEVCIFFLTYDKIKFKIRE